MTSSSATKLHEALATRKDTLLLARASAEMLGQAGPKPEKLTQCIEKTVYRDRNSLIRRRPVQTGTQSERITVSEGWVLTEQLTGDYPYHSNHDLLVLETTGSLAIVGYTSSFIMAGGHHREHTVALHTTYPQLTSESGYEQPAAQEELVQQRLAGLVVAHGLHEGTIFESVFAQLAGDS